MRRYFILFTMFFVFFLVNTAIAQTAEIISSGVYENFKGIEKERVLNKIQFKKNLIWEGEEVAWVFFRHGDECLQKTDILILNLRIRKYVRIKIFNFLIPTVVMNHLKEMGGFLGKKIIVPMGKDPEGMRLTLIIVKKKYPRNKPF